MNDFSARLRRGIWAGAIAVAALLPWLVPNTALC